MMKKNYNYIMITLFIVGFHSITYAQTMRGYVNNMSDLTTFDDTNPINNGDIIYVRSFRTIGDGGGGLFVYEQNATVNPVEVNIVGNADGNNSPFLEGYENSNGLYDGMVVVPAIQASTYQGGTNNAPSSGRWLRQSDKRALNLRWFGTNCSNDYDNSPAINTALAYAQFEFSNGSPYTSQGFTAPAKTIFIPAGTYYLTNPIKDITSGVVFEGEGNIADSNEQQGTELITQINYVDTAPEHIFSANQYGIFRYIAEKKNNSGGGFKNLTITVENTGVSHVTQNVITLFSPQVLPIAASIDTNTGLVNRDAAGNIQIDPSALEINKSNPAVSKWFAENVTIKMQGNALRAILMKSRQQGGIFPYRIQDPNIINCWFSGNTKKGETVTAINTDGLKIIGGAFTIPKDELENNVTDFSIPGVSLFVGKDYYNDTNNDGAFNSNDDILNDAFGCANVNLDGVDLSNGIIKLGEKSKLINIDCPFGRLEIAITSKSATTLHDGGHEGLQVTKQHTFNKRNFDDTSDLILSRLKCPSPFGQASDPGGIASNIIYISSTNSYIADNNYVKCFNCTQEIETDPHQPTFEN